MKTSQPMQHSSDVSAFALVTSNAAKAFYLQDLADALSGNSETPIPAMYFVAKQEGVLQDFRLAAEKGLKADLGSVPKPIKALLTLPMSPALIPVFSAFAKISGYGEKLEIIKDQAGNCPILIFLLKVRLL